MILNKISETSSTITLGWTPPPGVGGYVFWANGQAVSTGSPNLKGGAPRTSVKFSKTNPGPPFHVTAVCRVGGKRIVGPVLLPSSSQPYYTVATGVRTQIRNLHAINPSGSQASLTVSLGGSTLIEETIAADGILNLRGAGAHTLEAGEIISAQASPASTVVLVINGVEEAT